MPDGVVSGAKARCDPRLTLPVEGASMRIAQVLVVLQRHSMKRKTDSLKVNGITRSDVERALTLLDIVPSNSAYRIELGWLFKLRLVHVAARRQACERLLILGGRR